MDADIVRPSSEQENNFESIRFLDISLKVDKPVSIEVEDSSSPEDKDVPNSQKKFSRGISGHDSSSTGISTILDTDRTPYFTMRGSRSSIPTIEEENIQFNAPDVGTPAAKAIEANANFHVSSIQKGLGKIQRNIPLINKLNIKKSLSKRFKTKKQKRKHHFSRNFKGKVIDGEHELYILTAGMMLGMRCSVGHTRNASFTSLLMDDFTHAEKLEFPPNGSSSGPHPTPKHSLAHTFKMKTYAPRVFRRLRDFFGIDPDGYMSSVCGKYNYLEFIANSKSGQFFFYSHDGRYMIKTQTSEESKFLNRILPHYYKYVTENPDTLLVRFLGIHRVKMYHLRRKVHFVIMGSVFDTPQQINVIYDLKGSAVGRRATPAEREKGGVLKDLDLIEDGVSIQLGTKREAFLAQIRKDANFLAQHNIMDYSLLIGIHDRSRRGETLETVSVDQLQQQQQQQQQQQVSDNPPTPPNPRDLRHSQSIRLDKTAAHSNTPFRRLDRPKSMGAGSLSDRSSSHSLRVSEDSSAKRIMSYRGDHRTPATTTTTTTAQDGQDDASEATATAAAAAAAAVAASNGSLRDTVLLQSTSTRSDALSSEAKDSHRSLATDDVMIRVEEEDEEDEEEDSDDEMEDEGDSDTESPQTNLGTAGSDLSPRGTAEKADQKEIVAALDEALLNEGVSIGKIIREKSAKEMISRRSSDASPGTTLTFGLNNCKTHPWTTRTDGGINGRDGNGRTDKIYYAGVIDILQQYSASKRVEHVVKGFKYDRQKISAVDSVTYAKRFVEFLDEHIK